MDVLKLPVLILAGFGLNAWAYVNTLKIDPRQTAIAEQAKFLCNSTDEYIKTLKFLRSTKQLAYTEATSRMIAEKVSRGCNGASERFAQVLLLLNGVGLSDRAALAMALDFSGQSLEVQKTFQEIFTRTFLAEFFDMDHKAAFSLALELSKNYKGEPALAREDFITLTRYCKDGKTLDLPARLCSEYTIRLARLSQYFPDGVSQHFRSLYTTLREKREFMLDVKTALDIAYNVLKSGPRAPDNFYSAFTYAMRKDGLELDQKNALAFAIRMSDRSFVGGEKPPYIPSTETLNGDARAEDL